MYKKTILLATTILTVAVISSMMAGRVFAAQTFTGGAGGIIGGGKAGGVGGAGGVATNTPTNTNTNSNQQANDDLDANGGNANGGDSGSANGGNACNKADCRS